MPGLEQYAGMSLEEKVTVMLVKMDNLETFVMTKPCPSQACLKCQADVADFKAWKTKREAELAKEAEEKDDENAKQAWFWPLMITSALAVAALAIQIVAAL